MSRIALLLALSLVATTLVLGATPVASAGTCAPDEVAQAVCAVIGIPIDAVNRACQREFGSECITLG